MSGTAHLSRVTVLGAGTMGAQIAALLAGNGLRVTLLDLDADAARRGLERAAGARPPAFLRTGDRQHIVTGGFDDLDAAVIDADWILEAVIEQVQPKRDLLARVDAATADRDAPPIVSTNTSGLSIGSLVAGRSDAFRARFLGTHFFNPPRYTRLLELIPLPETDASVTGVVTDAGSRLLGKGTVVARDTPAFIANRLGTHGLLATLRLALELGLGPDEVDELTGPLVGRPKSATFRTLDLVGVDVAVAVADTCYGALPDDPRREDFAVPEVMRGLVERGALGEKSGAGFYRKQDGEILALDLESGEYRPRRHVQSGAVQLARNESDLAKRIGALVAADDVAGTFLRRSLCSSLSYAAATAPAIADDAASVDAAMRWGFGWELGPLELADALGDARATLLEVDEPVPDAYYENGSTWSFRQHEMVDRPERPGSIDLAQARRAATAKQLPSNAAASLVELPDDVLGLELHGKLNIIGLDTIAMLRRGVERATDGYAGLVIGTDAADFSAGANLALLLIEAEDGEWAELDRAVRSFQEAMMAMRYAPIPVVVAPRGRTLGGGAEMVLAADRAQALVETYIGLVEVGLGLIPAGGGSTAMARRVTEQLPEGARDDLFPLFQHVFTGMATARVAMGAPDAVPYLLLRECDGLTADPDRQWLDAARLVRQMSDAGYRAPQPARIQVLGRRGYAAAESLTYNQLVARYISEHDRKVVLELARVMSGDDVAEGTQVSEQYLLDLEREAFLRLLGERPTRDRIRHVLKTGKPLRN